MRQEGGLGEIIRLLISPKVFKKFVEKRNKNIKGLEVDLRKTGSGVK